MWVDFVGLSEDLLKHKQIIIANEPAERRRETGEAAA